METEWDLILLPQGDSISCAGCPARLALYLPAAAFRRWRPT